jgi:transposase-like protein
MTEVSLAFQKSHGRPGRKLLEHLERGLSLEAVAQLMGTELADLRPWIETFEREGLTRSSGQ